MNTTVSCELHLRLVVSSESSLPVPAGLRYDTADPYAVHATFHTGAEETVEWVFARDLLAEGLHRPTGTGDVFLTVVTTADYADQLKELDATMRTIESVLDVDRLRRDKAELEEAASAP